jgi:F-type H+-transporting ATPase subunit b
MRAWNKALQPVLLAILIGALPPAIVSATDAPVAGAHQEMKAAAQGAQAPAATGHQAAVAGSEAKAEGHGQVHSRNPLSAEKLKDLFWRTVNFLALVIILVKFGAKPIMSGLGGRQQRIRAELEDLTVRRDEAEKSYKEFEAKLAGMEKEMELIVERAIAQAQVEKVRILADAEKAAEDIKRQAEAAVQAELEDAKRILREEIAEQAAAMAEELIVKNLTPADQVAITEQYLERVGAVQ